MNDAKLDNRFWLTLIILRLNLSQMKKGHYNIIASLWFRSFLLLFLVCFSQLAPFYHLNHSHNQDSFRFVSDPLEIDAKESLDHHHFHYHKAQTDRDDHQHTYDEHFAWHIIRAQNPRILIFEEQYFISSIPHIITNDNYASEVVNEDFLFTDENYLPSFIIRGPPLFI